MKKIGKIKLNELNKNELKKKQLNLIRGGTCNCSGYACPCSGYPQGGVANSMNNSSAFSEMLTNARSAAGV